MSGENEPITIDWLRSVGFSGGFLIRGQNHCRLWDSPNFVAIELRNGHAATSISDGDVIADIPAGLCPKTRGDVVRLCVALGFGAALTVGVADATFSASA